MTTPAQAAPKVLLIVEDQVLIAMSLQDELEDYGYRVLELATRHQQALTTARTPPEKPLKQENHADNAASTPRLRIRPKYDHQ